MAIGSKAGQGASEVSESEQKEAESIHAQKSERQHLVPRPQGSRGLKVNTATQSEVEPNQLGKAVHPVK